MNLILLLLNHPDKIIKKEAIICLANYIQSCHQSRTNPSTTYHWLLDMEFLYQLIVYVIGTRKVFTSYYFFFQFHILHLISTNLKKFS